METRKTCILCFGMQVPLLGLGGVCGFFVCIWGGVVCLLFLLGFWLGLGFCCLYCLVFFFLNYYLKGQVWKHKTDRGIFIVLCIVQGTGVEFLISLN